MVLLYYRLTQLAKEKNCLFTLGVCCDGFCYFNQIIYTRYRIKSVEDMRFSGIKSASSKQWLARQQRDPYVKKAKQDGYRSRAAFKILEIDEKFKITKNAKRIAELGAAPGGWTQVLAQKLSSGLESGEVKIIGVDLLKFAPIPNVKQIIGNFEDESVKQEIAEYFDGQAIDLVLSDMAPATVGHAQTDHLRIMRLVEDALEFAKETMAEGGSFVAKIFHGTDEKAFFEELRRNFEKVSYFKPKSSRSMSVEIYVVAMGFRKCSRI